MQSRCEGRGLIRAILLSALLLLAGCARMGRAPAFDFKAAPVKNRALLDAAVQAFYAAQSAAEIRSAVDQAHEAGPDTAVYHELAANQALLAGMTDQRYDHLLAALTDSRNQSSALQLHWLGRMAPTVAQAERFQQVCRFLMHQHPQPSVRALAAYYLTDLVAAQGRMDHAAAIKPFFGLQLPLALIGTWDNDQGKGFDLPYPPEEEIDLDATYQGQLVENRWRTRFPVPPLAPVIDLGQLCHPNKWAAAYLAGGFVLHEKQRIELRASSSDALKIWVDGVPVFSSRHISDFVYDGIVIPLDLEPGAHQVLLKSAQETGDWRVALRLTLGQGSLPPPEVLEALPVGNLPVSFTPFKTAPRDMDEVLAGHNAMAGNNLCHNLQTFYWAQLFGLKIAAVHQAEALVKGFANGIALRFELMISLWDNAERSRTADALDSLMTDAGQELALIAVKQARFWRQNDLLQNARQLLDQTWKAFPDSPETGLGLMRLFDQEKWRADQLKVLQQMNAKWPAWPIIQFDLAQALAANDFPKAADALYDKLLAVYPGEEKVLKAGIQAALERCDNAKARRLARRFVRYAPHLQEAWTLLARTAYRDGDPAAGRKALAVLIDLVPQSPEGYRRLAEKRYLAGDVPGAVANWRQALERDPDNEKLANHLDYLAPPEQGLWTADIPDEAAISQALAKARTLTPDKGADTALLLDDMVTRLNQDGSQVNVQTYVTHILNESGRDSATRFSMSGSGHFRLLRAYSIDRDGRRFEASSIRGRTIRFRRLEVGSSTVVQFRNDAPPNQFLSQYQTLTWWFQNSRTQSLKSRFVLWAPESAKISQFSRGRLHREERVENGLRRIAWQAEDIPVLVPEPNMPPRVDVAWLLEVSTVPDWDVFLKWEDALLKDVFRESPEIHALAGELFSGQPGPLEKLLRIQSFLATRIRYQRDYEGSIAGVKPHAAPMVLARGYGDCKDKAVLFVTLARLAGIEAQLALVRTRSFGRIHRQVPMQRFNHVVVYVPRQAGLDRAYYFDPTVDALDADLLRADSQGTWSFVMDLAGGYAWRKIPFQSPDADYTVKQVDLSLDADGSARGRMKLSAHGRDADILRQTARNRERFVQLLQHLLQRFAAGAEMADYTTGDMTDIRRPVTLTIDFTAPVFARQEGRELRIQIPTLWDPKSAFTLESRKYPLILGAPRTQRMHIDIRLPAGAKIARVPQARAIDTPFFTISRDIQAEGRMIRVSESFQNTREQVPAEDYTALRASAEQIVRMHEAEIVVGF